LLRSETASFEMNDARHADLLSQGPCCVLRIVPSRYTVSPVKERSLAVSFTRDRMSFYRCCSHQRANQVLRQAMPAIPRGLGAKSLVQFAELLSAA
jgi:hypothetical protein